MKTCSKCKTPKEHSEFYKNRSRKDGLDIYCKSCRNTVSAINEDLNPETRSRLSKQRYERFRLFVDGLKLNKPCTDCGVLYPPYVMHFDHLDRKTKLANIAHMRDETKILEEVAKCELVCGNCHAIREYNRRVQ